VGGQDSAEIERRLEAGEWLRIGDLMILFGQPDRPANRSSVDRWIRNGAKFGAKRIVIRYKIDPSGDRLTNPEDISQVLAESRKIRSADYPDGIPDQPV
jgi:hypothetical protein